MTYKIYTDCGSFDEPFETTEQEKALQSLAYVLAEGDDFNAKSYVYFKLDNFKYCDFTWDDDLAAELQQVQEWCDKGIFPFRISCPEGDYIVYAEDEPIERMHCISHNEKHMMKSVDLW